MKTSYPYPKVLFLIIIASSIFLSSCKVEKKPAEQDAYLKAKAQAYTDFLIKWHSTGLGGVSDIVFTDESRTEILRTNGSGDSEDWTATYLVTQAVRYIITKEPQARDEVLRIANYLHIVKDITGDPGYLARYAAPDSPPWNVEYPNADNKYAGNGKYEGYFWLGHNVRDKYITWFWGLTWAYDALDDEDMRSTIKEDFREVILTLEKNKWKIIDPFGDVYSAADILPDIRLALLVQAAHVIDEPYFWDLLDKEYRKVSPGLAFSSIAYFNRYMEYYAFINNYSFAEPLFRLWPDRARFNYLFGIWKLNVRKHSSDTHNAFFDSVYYGICLRSGVYNEKELNALADDVYHGLTVMNDAPNYRRKVTCRDDLPLDSFSVWASSVIEKNGWFEDLTGYRLEIEPQTAVAHEVDDRCWEPMLWERSPYHLKCSGEEDQTYTGPGVDYLIGYWLGVYYGLLPGGGPYINEGFTRTNPQ
jgi:hypothetical protein